MKMNYTLTIIMLLLIILPNCGRVIDWGVGNFYQGKELTNFTAQVEPFIRSIAIYDQLETKAIFDVVWLSDQVRTAYANLHALRQGKSEEKLQSILRRQLEENNHYITFYVLSTYEVKLGALHSHWSFFLRLDGLEYHPFEIKEIELPYEYQIFFGKRWNRFKVPYRIRFKPVDDDTIVNTDSAQEITLIARSGQKEHFFNWYPSYQLPPKEKSSVMPKPMSKKRAMRKKKENE
jgi:hypothetical protein